MIKDVRKRMERAAENMQFERAAEYRDQLRALEHVVEKQRIVSNIATDQDVIAFARDEGDTCVEVLFIRGGKLLGQEYFVLDGAEGENDQEVVESFVKRFYDEAAYVPPEVVLPAQLDEANDYSKLAETKARRQRAVQTLARRQGQRGTGGTGRAERQRDA